MTQPLVLHAAEETLEAVHTRRHATYPVYKPSGVEWLGDVPEHWETLSLKYITNVQFSSVDKHTVDGEVPVRLCNYTDVYYNDSITEDLQFMEATATTHEISRFKLKCGDVLITKDSEDWSDIAVPSLVADEFADVLCGYHLAQIRPQPDRCTGAYLARAFASFGVMDQFHVAATGVTRYGLPKNALRKAIFPVPPLEEQQAIVRFLDEQTRKIDDLIEAKRSLLDLLKEKRQAVITHAVTRGLDPAAKLKTSGVEWLGDVPEHWAVKRLKHLGRIRYGLGEPPEYVDNGLPFIRATDIYRGRVNVNEVRRVNPSDVPWSRNPELQDKDILIVRSGAYTGDSAIVTKDIAGSIAGYDMVMSVTKAEPEYIAYSLLGKHLLEGQIYLSKLRAAQPHLNAEELGNCLVAIPSEAEQSAIVDHVREETEKIDDLESVVREAIETLELLRAGIISAAVTGKIDVREEGV